MTLDAEPVLYVERGGKGLVALREPDEALAAARAGGAGRLACAAGACRAWRWSASTASPWWASEAGALLIELGFRQGPRKLTLSA